MTSQPYESVWKTGPETSKVRIHFHAAVKINGAYLDIGIQPFEGLQKEEEELSILTLSLSTSYKL